MTPDELEEGFDCLLEVIYSLELVYKDESLSEEIKTAALESKISLTKYYIAIKKEFLRAKGMAI